MRLITTIIFSILHIALALFCSGYFFYKYGFFEGLLWSTMPMSVVIMVGYYLVSVLLTIYHIRILKKITKRIYTLENKIKSCHFDQERESLIYDFFCDVDKYKRTCCRQIRVYRNLPGFIKKIDRMEKHNEKVLQKQQQIQRWCHAKGNQEALK